MEDNGCLTSIIWPDPFVIASREEGVQDVADVGARPPADRQPFSQSVGWTLRATHGDRVMYSTNGTFAVTCLAVRMMVSVIKIIPLSLSLGFGSPDSGAQQSRKLSGLLLPDPRIDVQPLAMLLVVSCALMKVRSHGKLIRAIDEW